MIFNEVQNGADIDGMGELGEIDGNEGDDLV